jgi:superfamily I DNA/RNA helicase
MNNLKLILGGPGCGKTTRLLQIVAEEMATGIPSTAIAFVTFTKAAASEARTRAAAQFQLDPDHDLPWFRTIHSLAYSQLNISRDEMMSRRDWVEFGDVVGETITGTLDATDGLLAFSTKHIGDQLLHIYEYAMTTLRSLRDTWHLLNDAVDWHRLKRFVDALTAYKADTGKFDFIDLLHQYSDHGPPVPIQVAVIDEAQDLTAAQWAVVERAFSGAERVYVGGDDDQAIYQWAGADIQRFLTLSTTPDVLRVSHRLPRAVHELSRQVAARIGMRYTKLFRAPLPGTNTRTVSPSTRARGSSWRAIPICSAQLKRCSGRKAFPIRSVPAPRSCRTRCVRCSVGSACAPGRRRICPRRRRGR